MPTASQGTRAGSKHMQERRDKEGWVASPALSLLPEEEWGCQLVCLWGSLRRGSLATERDGFTFLSNLVGTSLACSVRRLPRWQSAQHTRESTHTGRSPRRPRGWDELRRSLGQHRACPGWELCGGLPASRGGLAISSCFLVLAAVWQAGRQQRQSPVPPALGTDQDWPGDPCCASHQEPSVVLP